jgi:transcriptional regulator with XRE-family HTH domain
MAVGFPARRDPARTVDGVDARDDMCEFLATRRAKLSPQQAGLPVYGAYRRVTGLRREEVPLLAGTSVEYYNRLERGNVGSVSESVLDGVAHALQLDEAEGTTCIAWSAPPTPAVQLVPRPHASGSGPRSNLSRSLRVRTARASGTTSR